METTLIALVIFLVVALVVEVWYFNFISITKLERKMYQELGDMLNITSDTINKISGDIKEISDTLDDVIDCASDSIDQTDKALVETMEHHSKLTNEIYNEIVPRINFLLEERKKPTTSKAKKKGRPTKEAKK